MSLSPETKKFHSANPSDLGLSAEKTPAMTIGIVKTTNHTGEQLSIDCPVYGDETREALKERLGFCYSVLQERMEDENRAVAFINKRQSIIGMTKEADIKNVSRLDKLFAKLEKEAKKNRWTEEVVAEKKKDIRDEADKAIIPNALRGAHAQAEMEANDYIDLPNFAADAGFPEWAVTELMVEEKPEGDTQAPQ